MPTKLQVENSRFSLIDIVRGLALIAMTIYHFAWDLEFFGWILPATTLSTGWVLFARGIASTFLILVGISLVLAHQNGIRWNGFFKRVAVVALAAALISITTYFAIPEGFIFFGILHAIALFSLLGILFVRLPWFMCTGIAILIYSVGQNQSIEMFSNPWLWWVGLATEPPVSSDYVPLFPWFSAVLAGMAFAKLSITFGWLEKTQKLDFPNTLEKPMTLIGKHSLLYYLIHQPILLGAIWLFTTIAGPPDRTENFIQLCKAQCVTTQGEKFCTPYCSCVAKSMKNVELFDPFMDGKIDITTNELVGKITKQCRGKFTN